MKTTSIALVTAASLNLAACESEPEAAPVPEGVVPEIEVTNARLVLAPVSGNPAAVYFDIAYTGDYGVAISGAEVEGAGSATLHNVTRFNRENRMAEVGPLPLRNGEPLTFEPGGLHIMAFEPADTLAPGGTTEVTLKISGGKTHRFSAEVRAADEER